MYTAESILVKWMLGLVKGYRLEYTAESVIVEWMLISKVNCGSILFEVYCGTITGAKYAVYRTYTDSTRLVIVYW